MRPNVNGSISILLHSCQKYYSVLITNTPDSGPTVLIAYCADSHKNVNPTCYVNLHACRVSFFAVYL